MAKSSGGGGRSGGRGRSGAILSASQENFIVESFNMATNREIQQSNDMRARFGGGLMPLNTRADAERQIRPLINAINSGVIVLNDINILGGSPNAQTGQALSGALRRINQARMNNALTRAGERRRNVG